MDSNEFTPQRPNLATRFENVFQRLLSGEELDLYAEGVSPVFEVMTANLLAEAPNRKYHWYDGVVGLSAKIRKPRQVEFWGEMWVGDDNTQWKEDFRVRVTNKRITKQGIWITLWLGSDRAEAELANAFGIAE